MSFRKSVRVFEKTFIRKPKKPCHERIDLVVDCPPTVTLCSVVEWTPGLKILRCKAVDASVMDELPIVVLFMFQEHEIRYPNVFTGRWRFRKVTTRHVFELFQGPEPLDQLVRLLLRGCMTFAETVHRRTRVELRIEKVGEEEGVVGSR